MKNNKAFTLVELIVVITILAILGTIAFISLQGYSADARDSTRISDTGSMKKTLELYQLRESKYPAPDLGGEVSYSGATLWTQGFFGEEVVKNLGKLISEAPLDPLTNTNYIYSRANNKKEFEILAIYEGEELTSNKILSKANADTFSPKISGNYNGVYIKTDSFIFPTPTIITSLEVPTETGITMTANDLKSQVVTGGGNLPKVGEEIEQVTGGLGDLNLNVYNGVIDSSSTPAEKIAAMEAIQNTYSSSTLLSNMEEISYVLSADSNEKKEAMIDIVVLDNGKVLSNSGEDDSDNSSEIGPNKLNYSFSYGNEAGGDSIIYDSITGLYWQSDGSSCSGQRGRNNADNCCGYLGGNWRLPTATELHTISGANKDYYYFTGNDNYYWTSTSYSSNKAVINYDSGVQNLHSFSNAAYLRCVHN